MVSVCVEPYDYPPACRPISTGDFGLLGAKVAIGDDVGDGGGVVPV